MKFLSLNGVVSCAVANFDKSRGRQRCVAVHCFVGCLCLLLDGGTLFLDACLLTREITEVVELSAAHLTNLVHLDAFDRGRFDGEDTFYANRSGHFANGETLFVSVTGDF